jgi:hypothetical protein
MLKRKTGLFYSSIALLVCWFGVPASEHDAHGGIWDPCASVVYSSSGNLLCCPQGDGERLDSKGVTITVIVRGTAGTPIPGIQVFDIWLVGCTTGAIGCGGEFSILADSVTNGEGTTTLSGPWAAGGCDMDGVRVVIQGVVVENANDVCADGCLPIAVASPDINSDLDVDVIDLSLFSQDYTSPPRPYRPCLDYDFNGAVDLVDFALFSSHYLHEC